MKIQIRSASKKMAWTILLLLFASLTNNAQSVKTEVNKKINNIKGDIEKITIIADGEEYLFSGEEAEVLFENMKSNKRKKFAFEMLDSETGDSNVWMMKGGDDDDTFVMFDVFEDGEDGDKIKKEIKIEIEDGEKKVEVTTTKEGKDSTEVYEGEEAEQYLKKMEKDRHRGFNFFSSDDNLIFIEKDKLSKDDDDLIEVIIDKDGKKKRTKKIIIKKMKDNDENSKDDD
jgi:hypothetical protein